MISICIPVYNFCMEPLVSALSSQISASGCVAEICLVDDGSEIGFKEANRHLANHKLVRYFELPQNIGRSAIRNYLAEMAIYPQLIFLDCDVRVNPSFFVNYIENLDCGEVVSGGVSYHNLLPKPNQLLHWKNGSKREVLDVSVRRNNPYQSFLSCNFMISKEVLQLIRFNEQIKDYGYEDAVLGMELSNRNIRVGHIDNPVVHLGIEDTTVFIGKIEKSIGTLVFMSSFINHQLLCRYIKLYRVYHRLPKLVQEAVAFGFILTRGLMRWQLHGKNPSLIVFDCYKLGYLCCEMKRQGLSLK